MSAPRPGIATRLLGPFGVLAEAFLRVFAPGRRPAATPQSAAPGPAPREPAPAPPPPAARRRQRRPERRSPPPLARRSRNRAQKLAARGVPRAEIARRLGIAQDAVGMLLNVGSLRAAESAGSGTLFRALRWGRGTRGMSAGTA